MDDVAAIAVSRESGELGEGARWDGVRRELLWVDVLAGRLYRARPDGSELSTLGWYDVGRHLGAVAPAAAGGWVLAAGQGFARLAEDGTVTVLAEPEAGRRGATRMNDGACDPAGRFWAGSMAYDLTPGLGSLHVLDVDGPVRTALTGLTISNGIGWSPDGATMYLVDSGPKTVDAFDFDVDRGKIFRRRTLVRIDEGGPGPDGLTVDDDGHLWVAVYGGSSVRRYTPGGREVTRVRLPVTQPTSCWFGGPRRDLLFVTTCWEHFDAARRAEQPDAGRVFLARPGVTGPAVTPYAGR